MLRRLSILGSLLLAACVPMGKMDSPGPKPAKMQSARNEAADWRMAQRENTKVAYREFIRRYPKSRFVPIATERMKTAVARKPVPARVLPAGHKGGGTGGGTSSRSSRNY